MATSIARIALILFLAAFAFSPSRADQGIRGEIETWTRKGLVSGATVTEAECVRKDRVWVKEETGGVCIRFFTNGLKAQGGTAILIFAGDLLSVSYRSLEDAEAELIPGYDAKALFRFAGAVPRLVKRQLAILVARPGTFGSSGDHKKRYRPSDARIVNTAMDQIKTRFGIDEFVLAGHSGGALLSAKLLARRNDIRCAVLASGPLALHAIAMEKGTQSAIWSGWEDPVELIEHIPKSATEYYVMAGMGDRTVPPRYQEVYARALDAAGLNVHYLILRKSSDPHGLMREAIGVATDCANGLSHDRIVKKLAVVTVDQPESKGTYAEIRHKLEAAEPAYVREWQHYLLVHDFLDGKVDGKFGPRTLEALNLCVVLRVCAFGSYEQIVAYKTSLLGDCITGGDLQRRVEGCLAVTQSSSDRDDLATAYFNLGLIAVTQRDFNQAISHMEKSLAYRTWAPANVLGDLAAAYVERAREHLANERYEEAIRDLARSKQLKKPFSIVAFDKVLAEAYIGRSGLRQSSGDVNGALADLALAEEITPRYDPLHSTILSRRAELHKSASAGKDAK
jgi:tetratricopeptide (TPR) repeat protein/pimeloyl-ACP methyl ester carboxylesterase